MKIMGVFLVGPRRRENNYSSKSCRHHTTRTKGNVGGTFPGTIVIIWWVAAESFSRSAPRSAVRVKIKTSPLLRRSGRAAPTRQQTTIVISD